MAASGVMTFRRVSFSYDGGEAIFAGLDLDLHRGFTGCVGANGAGKTTFLRMAMGELQPTRGQVSRVPVACYCPQRTDDAPPQLAEFLEASDAASYALRGRLEIDPAWGDRWSTLSHGERKRCQIGTAVWRSPDVLAIDEPTNHIDSAARRLLVNALRDFRGIGLLVSHDRGLLDELCEHCLWLDPPVVEIHRGGYTEASERRRHEAERDRADYEHARVQRDRLRSELQRRRVEAARSHHERSKRGLAPGDSDGRWRKNLARVSGKDGQAGRRYRQLLGRTDHAEKRLREIRVHRDHQQRITIAGTRSRRDLVVDVPAGALPLGPRWLHFGALQLTPSARVAVTGPNGSGKSTLLRHVCSSLKLPADQTLVLPQEVDAVASVRWLAEARRLPPAELGRVMAFIGRLGSRPDRLLESACPSPGELRKLLLARALVRSPRLILLDEPTNHLDLPSIESLEEALAGCPSALMLVSHDERFLSRLTDARWHLEVEAAGDSHVWVEEHCQRPDTATAT